jgi:hypothetical protein
MTMVKVDAAGAEGDIPRRGLCQADPLAADLLTEDPVFFDEVGHRVSFTRKKSPTPIGLATARSRRSDEPAFDGSGSDEG